MSNHKNVSDDEEFQTLLAGAGNKLVVVDFNATWCGPCIKMHPIFLQMAHKFPEALFLGVRLLIRHTKKIPTFFNFYFCATRLITDH